MKLIVHLTHRHATIQKAHLGHQYMRPSGGKLDKQEIRETNREISAAHLKLKPSLKFWVRAVCVLGSSEGGIGPIQG